jgi:hypothetical protein
MTEQGAGGNGQDGIGFAADAPPTEPGEVTPVRPPEAWPTVIGVLAIVFGSLGLLSGVCTGFGTAFMAMGGSLVPEEAGDMQALMAVNVPYPWAQGAHALLEFALSATHLVGGILLVTRRPAAARVLVGFAWADLVSNTLGAVLGYFVMRAGAAAMAEHPDLEAASAMGGMAEAMGAAWLVLDWLFTAVWPVFLIVWFARPRIRETVATWTPGG